MQLLRQACLTVLILCLAPLAQAQPADVPPLLEQGRRLPTGERIDLPMSPHLEAIFRVYGAKTSRLSSKKLTF